MTHVAVVGGGLAGCLAALGARQAGARVTLIKKAPGATALGSGAIWLGPVDAGDAWQPLNRLGWPPARLQGWAEEAAGLLLAACAERAPLAGEGREAGAYCDSLGGIRRAHLVPARCRGGELSRLSGRVAVAALPTVSDYDALAVTAALRALGVAAEAYPAEPDLALPPVPTTADLRRVPAPPPPAGFDHAAYPPGFDRLPPTGFELLATASSARTLAVQQALWQAVADAGAEVVTAEVTELEVAGRRVTAARTRTGTVAADAFVLATGRFIGGGLRKRGVVAEALLDLAVFLSGRPVREARVEISHRERVDPGPGFLAGLLTDNQLRPLDADRQVAFTNLRAAGSVLAGLPDPPEATVALVTGLLAGRWSAA